MDKEHLFEQILNEYLNSFGTNDENGFPPPEFLVNRGNVPNNQEILGEFSKSTN
jgi:hypothetical protein